MRETTARLEPVGVPGGDDAGVGGIYVARVELPSAGTYWFLAEPVGGRKVQALGNVVARRRSEGALGGRPRDRLEDADPREHGRQPGGADDVSPPRPRALPRVGRAGARSARAVRRRVRDPAVLPVAHLRADRRRRLRRPEAHGDRADSRFIHVEIYTDNDPAKGVNRWVKQWRLPTEPFTYVVDRTGVIRAKLEGAFSVAELERPRVAVAS